MDKYNLNAFFFDPFNSQPDNNYYRSETTQGEKLKKEKNSQKIKVQCKICDKSLMKTSLYGHLKLHQLKANEKQFKCEKCSKSFYTKIKLKRHDSSHTKPFICTLCGSRFASEQLIAKHSVLKRCEYCEVEFSCLGSYRSHLIAK